MIWEQLMAITDLNEVDQVYGTGAQVEFARRMAESLLKGGHYVPDASMAKLPGTWMYGVPNILKSLFGSQYRDIAGSQDKVLDQRMLTPNAQPDINRYGRPIRQAPKKTSYYDPSAPVGQPVAGMEGDDPEGNTAKVKMALGDTAELDSDGFIQKLIQTESGGNPNARTGSYRGLGQFGRAEEQRYGINDSNWNNPEVATNAIKKHMVWLTQQFQEKMGRMPTPGELYLAHQQGASGAPALLNNPDQPAWKVIRPYYKSDEMAKLAITGNIPNGHYLKKQPIDSVSAKDFANLWTSRFDVPQNATKLAAGGEALADASGALPANVQGEAEAAMKLGGPKPVEGSYDVAQAFPSQPVQPGSPVSPLPPAGPLETDAQLLARINRASTPEEKNRIMEDYLKRAQGTSIDTVTGKATVRPGAPGQPPIVSHTPSKTFPLTLKGLGLTMMPDEQGNMKLITPDGKGINSVEDLTNWVRKQEAMDTASQKITEQDTSEIGSAKDMGIKAGSVVKTLNILDTLSKSGNVPRGPFSKYSIAVRQFLDNIGLKGIIPVDADLGKAEVMQKINAELAAKVVTSFTNRGTNFELDTYMKNNPGLLQSKEGMELLLDIVRQEYQGQQAIGKIANDITPGNTKEFYDKVNEYYKNNPIVINDIINKKKINTYPVKDKTDVDKYVKSGQHFVLPDGSEGYKK